MILSFLQFYLNLTIHISLKIILYIMVTKLKKIIKGQISNKNFTPESDFIISQKQFLYCMPKHRRSRSRSRSKSPKNSGHHRDKGRSSHREYSQRNYHNRKQPKRKNYSSSSSSDSYGSRRRSEDSPHHRGADPIPNYKVQETKTLKIEGCSNKQAAERALTDASIAAATSVPDQVEVKDSCIFAKYPSIEVSTKIKELLKQHIAIEGKEYRINFYPFKRIDLNIAYDWFCDKCEYKNFARRNKCYRCETEKSQTCKLDYNTVPKPNSTNKEEATGSNSNINNCSLMIRGPIIADTEEETILQIFEAICSVKDIRMIRNKMTGQSKDFAFIQFFTPEDAALALKQSDFRVRGEKVTIMYSRNKSDDDYAKPLPYQKKERRKDFSKKDKKDEPVESYYNKQRQLEIEQEKLRPIITLEQLKQKHEQEQKKKASNTRELTQEQVKRRQAQLMAKQWERQAKMQNTVLYICVLCRRKFKGDQEMKNHQELSELHRWNQMQYELSL